MKTWQTRLRVIPVEEVELFLYKQEAEGTLAYICTHSTSPDSKCSTCDTRIRDFSFCKKSRRTFLTKGELDLKEKKPRFSRGDSIPLAVKQSDLEDTSPGEEGKVQVLCRTAEKRYWEVGTKSQYESSHS